MEHIEKKQRGGPGLGQGRKKGRNQTPKSFRIDDDLCEYLENQVGNKNAFVNMLIRNYKEQSEKLIAQINRMSQ